MARTFVYEIPNFWEEAKLIVALPTKGRYFESPWFHLNAPDMTGVRGRIVVAKERGNDKIEFRTELTITGPQNCSKTFSAADVIKGEITLELRKADGTLVERYDGKSKSLFWNTTCKFFLEIDVAQIKTATSKASTDSKDLVARVITSISFLSSYLVCKDEPVGVIPYAAKLRLRYLSDTTVLCEGKEFPVHALILSCVSPVFASMLKNIQEGEEDSSGCSITGVSVEAFEEMLEFIYTGDFKTSNDPLPDHLILQLLLCTDKFEFSGLKDEILKRMQSQLSVCNAVKYVQAAKTCGADENVIQDMMKFCKRNLSLFQKDAEFKEFFLENMEALI